MAGKTGIVGVGFRKCAKRVTQVVLALKSASCKRPCRLLKRQTDKSSEVCALRRGMARISHQAITSCLMSYGKHMLFVEGRLPGSRYEGFGSRAGRAKGGGRGRDHIACEWGAGRGEGGTHPQ